MSIDLEYEGKVAVITINNPAKLGALTKDMITQLGHRLREAAKRQDIYITLLTGKGRFFCSGADINDDRDVPVNEDKRRHYVARFSNLMDISHTFYTHSNILVTALNGPVVGLASVLVSHSDFIYATPHTYLLSPFNSIGIVVEGAATRSMAKRMGWSKAKEALLMAKRISISELKSTGFVNDVFEADPSGKDDDAFRRRVLEEVCAGLLGDHLSSWSMLRTKKVMAALDEAQYDAQLVREMMGGVEAYESGYPQDQFARMRRKEKRHKM